MYIYGVGKLVVCLQPMDTIQIYSIRKVFLNLQAS